MWSLTVGTALTHWEKRAFENEAMTGTHTQNPVYSRITLALMEDTGWYRANMELAQPLNWGRNLGCDFAKRSCMEWMETRAARWHFFPFFVRLWLHPCDKPQWPRYLRTDVFVTGSMTLDDHNWALLSVCRHFFSAWKVGFRCCNVILAVEQFSSC